MTYPFGRNVTPRNASAGGRRPLFVLGAYPSALHVRWVPPSGKPVAALPVDDEPEPFWNGHDAAERIAAWLEWLQPDPEIDGAFAVVRNLNGPSGAWVESKLLAPMNQARSTAWITDCLDTYRMSTGVAARIDDTYVGRGLPSCSISTHPSEGQIVAESLAQHRNRLLGELARCRPETVVTLGNAAARVMADLVSMGSVTVQLTGYGTPIDVKLDGRPARWYPLAHPAAPEQYQLAHTTWMEGSR